MVGENNKVVIVTGESSGIGRYIAGIVKKNRQSFMLPVHSIINS